MAQAARLLMTAGERLRRGGADLLIVAAGGGAVARLAGMSKSFWGDEILSLRFAAGSAASTVAQTAADYHPPLYFLLLKGWVTLFGSDEMKLRLFQGAQGAIFLYLSLLLFRRTWRLHQIGRAHV